MLNALNEKVKNYIQEEKLAILKIEESVERDEICSKVTNAICKAHKVALCSKEALIYNLACAVPTLVGITSSSAFTLGLMGYKLFYGYPLFPYFVALFMASSCFGISSAAAYDINRLASGCLKIKFNDQTRQDKIDTILEALENSVEEYYSQQVTIFSDAKPLDLIPRDPAQLACILCENQKPSPPWLNDELSQVLDEIKFQPLGDLTSFTFKSLCDEVAKAFLQKMEVYQAQNDDRNKNITLPSQYTDIIVLSGDQNITNSAPTLVIKSDDKVEISIDIPTQPSFNPENTMTRKVSHALSKLTALFSRQNPIEEAPHGAVEAPLLEEQDLVITVEKGDEKSKKSPVTSANITNLLDIEITQKNTSGRKTHNSRPSSL